MMTCTGTLVPLTTGLPPIIPGSIVMRSRQSISCPPDLPLAYTMGVPAVRS